VLVIRRTLAHGRLIGLATGLGTATADTMYASVAGFGLTSIAALLAGLRFWMALVGGLFLCYLGIATLLSKPSPQDPLAPAGERGNDPLVPPAERVRRRGNDPLAPAGERTRDRGNDPLVPPAERARERGSNPLAPAGERARERGNDPLAPAGERARERGSNPLAPPAERVRGRGNDPLAPAGERGRLLGAYLSSFLLTITNPLTILSFAAVFAALGVASGSRDYAAAALLVLGVFAGSASWWFILSSATSLLRARFDARWLRWVNRVSGVIFLVAGVAALWSLV
jgi:threonine/homoserine/homoserine lactone efflux protein